MVQSVHWRTVLCLVSGEWMGAWEERGNLQHQREASCGERMKAGLVILAVWKYEEGQSFEVLCIKIYREPQES